MALNPEIVKHLLRVKEEIEEILSEIGDIVPPEFRTTCILRYCGDNPDVADMIWTDDVTYDAAEALKKYQEGLDDE